MTTKTKFAVRREDGTYVGRGGRGRCPIDTAYLYAKKYDFTKRKNFHAMDFYVAPGEDTRLWENVTVEVTETRTILRGIYLGETNDE